VLAGGMSAVQEWLLPPRRIEISQFGEWARKSLCESDAVVIETCLPFAQPGATALHFSQNLLLRATLQAHPHRLSAQSKLLFVIHAFSLSQKA
jgi:hypothetical protein